MPADLPLFTIGAGRAPAVDMDIVFYFATTHDTIKADRLARAAGVAVEVIPRPPGKSGRCGIALAAPAGDRALLETVFREAGVADFDVEEK